MTDNDPSFLKRALSSTSGAIITAFIVTPLDVVKVRLQLQNRSSSVHRSLFVPHVNNTIRFTLPHTAYYGTSKAILPLNGTISSLSFILKNEGVLSLWRGLLPALIMSIPSSTIYLLGFEYMKSKLCSFFHSHNISNEILNSCAIIASGVISRTLAVATVSPLELIRTRTQALTDSNLKALKLTLRSISCEINRTGIGCLWRGLIPTLWRDVPFSAIYWLCYENMRPKVSNLLPSNSNIVVSSFLTGLSSGVFAAFITTPFDVAKTRRQVLEKKSGNFYPILCDIYKNEGVTGLFKGFVYVLMRLGLTPRLMKVAPACAIMITIYEAGKQI